MTQRLIIVNAEEKCREKVLSMAEETGVLDCHLYAIDEDGQYAVHILAGEENRQAVLDKLQNIVGSTDNWRITILPVEATLPQRDVEKDEEGAAKPKRSSGESREEMYNDVLNGARLDVIYLVFVALSAIVAAIGLIDDNVAVVVGAMVIAPLLGPNLAFALGVALGDQSLMVRAIITNLAGVACALVISILLGLVVPLDLESRELMSRTEPGFGGIAIALASGAAAALSLSTGLSAALVGVMVSVALLPPTAVLGLMIGAGYFGLAAGAAMLLAVNLVCLNLSAQLTFVLRGVRPRTWFEKKNARKAVLVNAGLWAFLLIILAVLLWFGLPQLLRPET
jgi:uncharacterized hydrophobic protein (TIGR00341 family)